MPRVNIKVSDEIKKYFEERAKLTGATQSSLMSMALADYVMEKKTMESMTELNQMLKLNPSLYKDK